MEHLTDKIIFDFAHVKSFDEESAATVNAVNRHILECRACAEKVALCVRYYDAVGSILEGSLPLSSGYGASREQLAAAASGKSGERNVY